MEKHHRMRLNLALEELADTGFVEIKLQELYRTFDAERLTKGVWRQLLERFSGVLDENEEDLASKIRVVFPRQKDGIILLYRGLHDSDGYVSAKTLENMTE